MSKNVFSVPLPLNNDLWESGFRLSVIFPEDFEEVYFIVL